jgi:hypothetical protein
MYYIRVETESSFDVRETEDSGHGRGAQQVGNWVKTRRAGCKNRLLPVADEREEGCWGIVSPSGESRRWP